MPRSNPASHRASPDSRRSSLGQRGSPGRTCGGAHPAGLRCIPGFGRFVGEQVDFYHRHGRPERYRIRRAALNSSRYCRTASRRSVRCTHHIVKWAYRSAHSEFTVPRAIRKVYRHHPWIDSPIPELTRGWYWSGHYFCQKMHLMHTERNRLPQTGGAPGVDLPAKDARLEGGMLHERDITASALKCALQLPFHQYQRAVGHHHEVHLCALFLYPIGYEYLFSAIPPCPRTES